MELGTVTEIFRSSLLIMISLAGPVLLVAMAVGLIVSILQATTSIQEQTLTFVPKIVAILVVLILLGGWMTSRLVQFTVALFEKLPGLTL